MNKLNIYPINSVSSLYNVFIEKQSILSVWYFIQKVLKISGHNIQDVFYIKRIQIFYLQNFLYEKSETILTEHKKCFFRHVCPVCLENVYLRLGLSSITLSSFV